MTIRPSIGSPKDSMTCTMKCALCLAPILRARTGLVPAMNGVTWRRRLTRRRDLESVDQDNGNGRQSIRSMSDLACQAVPSIANSTIRRTPWQPCPIESKSRTSDPMQVTIARQPSSSSIVDRHFDRSTLRRQPMRAGPHDTPIHTCLFKETLRYSTTTR